MHGLIACMDWLHAWIDCMHGLVACMGCLHAWRIGWRVGWIEGMEGLMYECRDGQMH